MNNKNTIVGTISEAWQTKHPEKLISILSPGFKWYDSPFEEVIVDQSQLVERWRNDIAAQKNITVTSDIISETSDTIVAHWHAEFDRNNKHEILDGIYVIGKSKEGLLSMFRMWWVSQ